jgi:precorrin-8X/cobalt-precorrin-8 methylmutase
MNTSDFILDPKEIEKKSFEIISGQLNDKKIDPQNANVIKRVIHTTADFDYADNLVFSENAVDTALNILKQGANIITDTQMAKAGINKKSAASLNCNIHCFIDCDEVADTAKEKGTTRSMAAVEYAAKNLAKPLVFIVGNAPTALIRLYELILQNKCEPSLIIGVPVGFVNVVEAKDLIVSLDVPYIVAKGKKGGSNVAAAICNALLYEILN